VYPKIQFGIHSIYRPSSYLEALELVVFPACMQRGRSFVLQTLWNMRKCIGIGMIKYNVIHGTSTMMRARALTDEVSQESGDRMGLHWYSTTLYIGSMLCLYVLD
jgi:hypothetical protein